MIRIKSLVLFILICFFQQNLLAQNQKDKRNESFETINTPEEANRVVNSINRGIYLYTFAWKNISEPKKAIDSLLLVLKNAKEDSNQVKVLNHLAAYYRIINELTNANEYAEKAVSIGRKINFKTGEAFALNLLGLIERAREKYDSATGYFQAALSINENIGNKYGVAINLTNIANIYKLKGFNPMTPLKYQRSALKIFEEIGDEYEQMQALLDIARTNEVTIQKLKGYFTILDYGRKVNNKKMIAVSLEEIGNCYRYQGSYAEAMKNFKESLGLMRELEDKVGIAHLLGGIAVTHGLLGNYDESIKAFNECLNAYRHDGSKGLTGYILAQFGFVLTANGNYSEALKTLLKALKIWKEIGQVAGIEQAYIHIGAALSGQATQLRPPQAKKKYNEAIWYLNKGILLVLKDGNKEFEKRAYKAMSEIYLALNDHKKALKYHVLYDVLKDSLLDNETIRRIEQVRLEYETDKAVAEEKVKQEKKDAEAKILLQKEKAEKTRRTEVFGAGLGALFLISIFTIIIIRQRNQKRRAIEKAETGHKMAELELQSLRAQLNPHFMFNSLNAIQDLILKEDNDRSHLYLSRFSKLLRMLLDNANQPFVTVKQELELLELYLSLENLRIPNLQYSIERDPKLNSEERMIPNMMLQPYIENAIWHGLSNKKGDRKLQIRIHENGNATEFEVEDNGIGRKKAAEIKAQYRHGHHSKGMELLSKRFNLLSKEYGEAIQTTVTDLENDGVGSGTLVKIDVPFSLSKQARQLVNDTNNHN